jgi:hypothetical protein
MSNVVKVTHAQGVNYEQGTVSLPVESGWPVRVQLTDEQIKLLAAGVLAREQGYALRLSDGLLAQVEGAPNTREEAVALLEAEKPGGRHD